MCGITGYFDLAGLDPIDRARLQAMNDAIAHRGPDGDGFHLEPGVGLAMRRLAIIDVAGGQQPIYNEHQSVAIVYNGEIYNYRELTAELVARGHRFRTHSDTEAVVHAWEEWGEDCVTRFRGMFAFAIFDRNRQSLFLARDRLGKKPLYYTFVRNRHCLFGSELKALLAHPQVPRTIDPIAVDDYLAFGYVPDPATIYNGVLKLPAGHTLLLERGKAARQPRGYWHLRFDARPVSEASASEALIAHLSEAVRLRLISEVPLGAFLSGGVDSSGVVAMMARESAEPVKTFAIGFGDFGIDELPHADRVARRYNTAHTNERVQADFLSAYKQQAAIFDEPFADSSAVPTYQVSKLARRHVTVSLSGDAGDEVFAGYRRYRAYSNMEAVRDLIPDAVRSPLFRALGRIYPKLDWAPRWLRAKYTFHELALDEIASYYRMVCKIHDEMRTRLYSPRMGRAVEGRHPAERIATYMRESGSSDPLSRAQFTDIKTYLPGDILTKVDRASMATSLEARVPILDHVFVEWAATLPSDLRLHKGEGKYIFKRALEPYVPRENLYRAKQGFAASLADQFRGAGEKRLRSALLGESMHDCELFDMGALGRLIDAHGFGRADHSQALWSLLMFEGFLSEVHFASRGESALRPEAVGR
jgi:asparagine synthase (glutamine-hydrolysing)